MDFGSLLHAAKENCNVPKNGDGKYYSTKYAPPKKVSKEKKLSENIKKFLAKQEQEERERLQLEKQKRDQLLAMRDNKSKNKIKKMLKVIKSANKSVLEDAVDNHHTALTRQGGDQPDQDDYGYESAAAKAFYEKYIEKVKHVHEDKQFTPSRPVSKTDINGTKERVKAALEREIMEKNQPRVRSTAPKPASDSSAGSSGPTKSKELYNPEAERELEEKKKREEKAKAKSKKPPPPILDFQALMKLAEKNQNAPVKVEAKKKEPERRLLTEKEKKAIEEEKRALEARERRKKEGSKANRQNIQPNERIPKANQSGPVPVKVYSSKSIDTKPASFKKPSPPSSTSSAQSTTKTSASSSVSKTSANGIVSSKEKSIQKPTSSSSKPSAKTAGASTNPSSTKAPYTGPTREFPPRELKPTAAPKSREQAPQKTRQFPPPDVRRTTKPVGKKKPLSSKRRIYDDDDDEYDSELDDFIADESDEEDYSSHIKAIFGYDKSRYRDEDDDCSAMVSSFAQQMREEQLSKKLGKLEDLEDMRQEAEDKKRKALMKKRKLR